MLHPDWLIELGRYLERVRRVETEVASLKKDVSEIHTLIRRAIVLTTIWGGAIVASATSERGAELVAGVLRAILSR